MNKTFALILRGCTVVSVLAGAFSARGQTSHETPPAVPRPGIASNDSPATAEDDHPRPVQPGGMSLSLKGVDVSVVPSGAGAESKVPRPSVSCTTPAPAPAGTTTPGILIAYGPMIALPATWTCGGDVMRASPGSAVVCSTIKNKDGVLELAPNKGFSVFVARPNDSAWASHVVASGDSKLQLPQIIGASEIPSPALEGKDAESTAAQCVLDEWWFGPRAAPFTVTSTLIEATGKAHSPSTRTVEVIVAQRYIGAIRIGVGAVFPFAPSPDSGTPSYSVRPGANGTNVINRDSWTPLDLELIAGYTAFLPQRKGSDVGDVGFGWFFGGGLISVSPSTGNVTGLTSLYTGPELSFAGAELVGLIGVRRDVGLASGYQLGESVPANQSVTTTEYKFALGIMLGYSADVFKIPGGTGK